MKAFLAAVGAAIVIAVVAGFALNAVQETASEYYQAEQGSVRL